MSAVAVDFDRARHRYSVQGRPVPSVTEVLAPLACFQRVPPAILQAAAERGTAVHKACELDDLGRLDERCLSPTLRGYLLAWRAFSVRHAVRWELVERCVYHAQMDYAGTVDRYGLVAGAPAVVDLKTSATAPLTLGPQLAAYAKAIAPVGAGPRRLGVLLRPDGSYRVYDYEQPADWAVFASLLTLRRYCQEHRISLNLKEQLP